VVSGDVVSGAAAVASLRRVFEAREVACSEALPPVPTMTEEMRAEEIAGVEDTLRLTVSGTTLEVAVVETIYRREGGSGVGVPGVAGARGPLPASACGCRATRAEAPPLVLVLVALAVGWRRQR
jgi:MYXO-CTERM domain-containing protein